MRFQHLPQDALTEPPVLLDPDVVRAFVRDRILKLRFDPFFWNELFGELTGRKPRQVSKPGRYPEDDRVWDVIIPLGFREIRRLLEGDRATGHEPVARGAES